MRRRRDGILAAALANARTELRRRRAILRGAERYAADAAEVAGFLGITVPERLDVRAGRRCGWCGRRNPLVRRFRRLRAPGKRRGWSDCAECWTHLARGENPPYPSYSRRHL